MKARACLPLFMVLVPFAPETPTRMSSPDRLASGEIPMARPADRITELVRKDLRRLGTELAPLCDDACFLRRVYLDCTGTIPSADRVRRFLKDESRNKRDRVIDELLGSKEFAEYYAMKFSDLLRVKSEFPINLWPNAAQAYYQWIWQSLRDNKPYDQFARELLTTSGSNFRQAPVNFYRAVQNRSPEALASAVALSLMGARADKWSKKRLRGFSAFFSKIGFKRTAEWKEEIVFFDAFGLLRPKDAKPYTSFVFPDGSEWKPVAQKDPRLAVADWLIRGKNPWFSKCMVNRVWAWLFGTGIIDEPDDIRPDNPPVNSALLQQLERSFVASRYDLRALFRSILRSTVYQSSSKPVSRSGQAAGHFAWYPLRHVEAEVLIDSICRFTGTTENYMSMIPEPFTFVPTNLRSVTLPDGSIGSPFLEIFGRPSRDTGYASERGEKTTPTQRLHLLNSTHILSKLERGTWLAQLYRQTRGRAREVLDHLYLTLLSRYPTTEERGILVSMRKLRGRAARNALVDLAWALINSAEFQFKH